MDGRRRAGAEAAIASLLGASALHPVSGETITVVNLLSGDGVRRILSGTVGNFTGFAPLGTVLVAMLGIGVAERAGLLDALLRRMVSAAPPRMLTFIVVFAGVLSSLGADSGYVVLVPLAALMFFAAGRHPLAGIAAAFAGVSAGFSANLLIGPLDAILAGLSTEAVQLVDPSYEVTAAGNWWFIIASTALIAVVATFVTERITEPRLGATTSWPPVPPPGSPPKHPRRRRRAGCATRGSRPPAARADPRRRGPDAGVLRDATTGSVLRSPFISGIVVIIALWAGISGIADGRGCRHHGLQRRCHDRHGADHGHHGRLPRADVLRRPVRGLVRLDQPRRDPRHHRRRGPARPRPGHAAAAAVLHPGDRRDQPVHRRSASAKWAIMAPVFVPMLFLLGISPEATQMAYRIGDSVSNIVTPLMPYLALVVAFAQQHDRRDGIGTVIATMLPYSSALMLAWAALLDGLGGVRPAARTRAPRSRCGALTPEAGSLVAADGVGPTAARPRARRRRARRQRDAASSAAVRLARRRRAGAVEHRRGPAGPR